VFDYPPFKHRKTPSHIRKPYRICSARNERQPEACGSSYSKARNPEFYLAHFDLTGKIGNILTAVGASGLPNPDGYVSCVLTKSPVVSIARDPRLCPGREQRVSSSPGDMRFASRGRTRDWGQPEVGGGIAIQVAAVRNVFHNLVGSAAGPLEIVSRRKPIFDGEHRGAIRIRQPVTSGCGAGRLRRRSRAAGSPPSTGRAIAGAKKSRQPCFLCRPADRPARPPSLLLRPR